MLEMWGGVSGGQAGAATPDGGSGAQGRKQTGEEAVIRVSNIEYRIWDIGSGGRWKVEGGRSA